MKLRKLNLLLSWFNHTILGKGDLLKFTLVLDFCFWDCEDYINSFSSLGTF
jgi:hypothetical protein